MIIFLKNKMCVTPATFRTSDQEHEKKNQKRTLSIKALANQSCIDL